MSPDGGARNTVFSVEVHIVAGPVVISSYFILDFFVNVPTALNETVPPVGTPSGPMLTILVLVAAGRGVKVGVAVFVGLGVFVGGGVGVKVGEGGAPVEIVMESSEKPGVAVAVLVPLLPPPQLSRIAPKTNNTTGATTSNLSHRDNIKG